MAARLDEMRDQGQALRTDTGDPYKRTYPSMPGALPSIMPGQTWRDNGHKALCPLSGVRGAYP
eukprot:COSAG02_NODE_4293_length_5540_cov_2.278258_1_plen_62_part_10